MQKLFTAALAGAFATASTFAMLAYGVQHPAAGHQQILGAAVSLAIADNENDNEHGNNNDHSRSNNCVNPAGHTKGWCKHQGDNEDGHHGKRKHHGNRGGNATISGTVTSINGNLATVQLDNGGMVLVNENGTALNVGQHYNLNGCYSNNQFVLNCNNNNNNNRGHGGNASVHGTIMSVGNGTITLLGVPTVTINVQQAINNNATNGALNIGRSITAYGYYSNNVFYATSIQ